MKFSIKRDLMLKSLAYIQGVVEKKNTLPILSNVLIIAKERKLNLVATDLDLVFYDEIEDLQIEKEGSTTTSAAILYDILRKISTNTSINFDLTTQNKLNIKSDNSDFNLLCLPTDNFPTFSDKFDTDEIQLNKNKFLSLLNKTKISMSSDETRHYLNGVFLHTMESDTKTFLAGVSTDSHRLSSSSLEIGKNEGFNAIILPRKTIYQLITLISEINSDILIKSSETKVLFKIGKTKLVSKIIDGKFPDYKKVIPNENKQILVVPTKEFISSIERVIAVSIDKKEGVKLEIKNDHLRLSVISANSGEGNEKIKANYSGKEMAISFNAKYLLDIASEVEDKNLQMNLKDSNSPVLIEDKSDKDSFYVIMPMKI